MKRATENASELLRALMEGPKTCATLRHHTGMNQQGVTRWLNALRSSGVVRCCGEEKRECDEQGRKAVGFNPLLFELQRAPFALEEYVRISAKRATRRKPIKAVITPAPTPAPSPPIRQRDWYTI